MAAIAAMAIACATFGAPAASAAEAGSGAESGTSSLASMLGEAAQSAFSGLFGQGREQVKQSPDKYTAYVRDYTGLNLASVGYTSLGGDRREYYGSGNVKLVLVASDGSYIDPEDEDALKQWVVYGQNLAPNTEIKFIFETDSEGNEYSSLVQWQSVEEIVLDVRKADEGPGDSLAMTPITPDPDRYTAHVRDYVGRNLGACGYTSLGGDRRDAYGAATVKLVLMADDGSYIDPQDQEALKQWVVAAQDVPADTLFTMTYELDSDGNEYDNLTDTVSLDSIILWLTRAPAGAAQGDAEPEAAGGEGAEAAAEPEADAAEPQGETAAQAASADGLASAAAGALASDGAMTLAEYDQIQEGMTYEQVVQIVGGEGEQLSSVSAGYGEYAYSYEVYSWAGNGVPGSNAVITFSNGAVDSKAQAGLL